MSPSAFKIYSTTSAAWEAMLAALRSAKRSIYWEVYILVDDRSGNRFFEALKQKARQGVEIKLIVDYWGSLGLSRRVVDELKALGADVRYFQGQRRWSTAWRSLFASRTHRKLLIVDEKVGFIGGVNVDHSMRDWWDIQVEVRGKVLRSLLRSFARSYVLCNGKRQAVRHLLTAPAGEEAIDKEMRSVPSSVDYSIAAVRLNESDKLESRTIDVIEDQPHRTKSLAKDRYMQALAEARQRVIFFSPYYFPDRKFLRALWRAKQRSVRVDLLLPLRSDVRVATYLAYGWFALMRRYGVKVHLLKQMMHGKGVIVDDEWAMVGSSNLDYLSWHRNHEVNVRVKDKRLVRKLTRVAESWLRRAEPLDHERWSRRGFWQRLKEVTAAYLYRWWFGIK